MGLAVRPPNPPTQRRLAAVALAAAVVSLAAYRLPLASVAAAVTCIWVLNFVLLNSWIQHPFVHVGIRSGVYALPLAPVGVDARIAAVPLGLAVVVPLLFHVAQQRQVRIRLNRGVIGLRPFGSRGQKAAQIVAVSLSGPCQEFLYRYALIAAFATVLPTPGVLGWSVLVLVSTVLFVTEHFLGLRPPPRTTFNVLVWTGCGVLAGPAGSCIAAAIAHFLVNLPATIEAARRPTDQR